MMSGAERIELLKKTDIFGGLSERECTMLAPVFKVRTLEEGEELFRQGDPGDFMAVVSRGRLVIEVEGDKKVTVVSRRRVGEAVGEMSSIDPAARSATVRASAPSEVLILSRTMLDSLKVNAPGLFSRVVRGVAYQLAERLDETNELLSGMLQAKRSPTGPRQPSLGTMQEARERGRAPQAEVELRRRGVLKAFDDKALQVLRTVTVAREFDAGAVICLEGEVAKAAYIVAQGEVDVVRTLGGTTYRLATISEGGFLGQLALLREERRSATLRAKSSTATILGLSKKRFDRLLEDESTLAIEFQEMVTVAGIRQLRQANNLTAYLGVREEKRVIPGPRQGRSGDPQRAKESVRKRVQKMAESKLDKVDDVESLAAAYLETSMQNWDVTPSELKNIRVVHSDGEMSAAEKKMRQKFKK